MFSACLIIVLIAVASRDAPLRPLYEARSSTARVALAWQPPGNGPSSPPPSAETRDDGGLHDEDTPDDVTETTDETDHRSHDDFHPSMHWRHRFSSEAMGRPTHGVRRAVAEDGPARPSPPTLQFSLDG